MVQTDAVVASLEEILFVLFPQSVIFLISTFFWVSSCPLAACHTPSVLLAVCGCICVIGIMLPWLVGSTVRPDL